VRHTVQPFVLNLKREEHPAWLQRAANFRKSSILLLTASQVMQHENRNRRRKTPIRERQHRRIALNHSRIRAIYSDTKLLRKRVIIFKTRHTTSEAPQLFRRCSWPRTQLKHVSA
jgi:hypothetical protein